jgi:hypothetical protein
LAEKQRLVRLVEKSTREVREGFEAALKNVEKIKWQMNELELRIDKVRGLQNDNSLSVLSEDLDKLTDNQILKSEEAIKKYGELKQQCGKHGWVLPQLNDLETWCKKSEQLASDLLCYSLGLLRKDRETPG